MCDHSNGLCVWGEHLVAPIPPPRPHEEAKLTTEGHQHVFEWSWKYSCFKCACTAVDAPPLHEEQSMSGECRCKVCEEWVPARLQPEGAGEAAATPPPQRYVQTERSEQKRKSGHAQMPYAQTPYASGLMAATPAENLRVAPVARHDGVGLTFPATPMPPPFYADAMLPGQPVRSCVDCGVSWKGEPEGCPRDCQRRRKATAMAQEVR
jgi:hypothetical protein